ncbi:MAG: DUF421 domain-containing protein [Thermoanaerobacteraceae bacterium]|nr:DUF421 domain-containing protein [Thermoanaerobacteraceae bacterium]
MSFDIIWKTALMYIVVVVSMRLMGKRQIGEFQPFEFAIAVMISELAAFPLTEGDKNVWQGIWAIGILVVCQFILSLLSIKSLKIRAIICGRPRVVIKNGKFVESNLKKELYTINDVLEQLRIFNVQNISDVEYGILETNGQLSIVLKSQKRAVTPADLGIETKYEGLTLDLIIDGVVLMHSLKLAKLDLNWLLDKLKENGWPNPKDIFYAYLDTEGNFYFQPKQKAAKNRIVERED